MLKTIGKIAFAALLTATVLGTPPQASAQDTNTVTAPATTKKARTSTPFSGKLGAIDKVAKSITLDDKTKRVFQITSQTRILKGAKGKEKPATLEDGTIGEQVTGSWAKDADGKMALNTLYFRGAAEPKATAKTDTKPATKKKKTTKPAATPPTTNAVPPDAIAPPK